MSKLDELIKKLCPDGVKKKRIIDVLFSIHGGLNPRQNFKLNTGGSYHYVTVKEITTGKIIFSEKTDKIDLDAWKKIQARSHLEKGDVLLSGIGTIGKVAVVDIDTNNWNCSESVLLLKPKPELISSWYLKYVLESKPIQSHFDGTAVGSTLKGIRIKDLEELEIPVPPVEIQGEIIRILDNFTELTAELTAELIAREKQYEYYKKSLLSLEHISPSEIRKIKLGQVGKVCMCKRIMKDQTSSNGDVPFYKIGTFGKKPDAFITRELFEEYRNKYSYPNKGDILISCSGTIGRTVVFDGEDSYFQDSNIVWIKNNEKMILNRYLYYLYQLNPFIVSTGGTISRLYKDGIERAEVIIPSLKTQSEIITILDRFEDLTKSITEGLPAEIVARQKQYEYYRDKLLTFKELV